MASSIGRKLAEFAAKLTFPLKPELGGVPATYIDGLTLTYVSANAVTVSVGTATVNGVPVVVSAPIALTGLVTTANTLYHFYLYNNAGVAAVEYSTAVPVAGAGTSFYKTGDSSRRYLGSVLSGVANTIFPFTHNPGNYIEYLVAYNTAPFTMQDAAVIGPARVSCAAVVPVTGYRMRALFTNAATDRAVYFLNPIHGADVSLRYDFYVLSATSLFGELGLNAALQYEWGFRAASNGTSGVYVKGYYFKR